MGYIASKLLIDKFGKELPDLYGKIVHVEMDIPTGYCRLDLAWYGDKEASVKKRTPIDTWSFVLEPELMNNLLKSEDNQSALQIAYTSIRGMDERFNSITDDI